MSLESQIEFSDLLTLRNVVGFVQTLHENLASSILDYQNNGTKILDQFYLGTKIPQKIVQKSTAKWRLSWKTKKKSAVVFMGVSFYGDGGHDTGPAIEAGTRSVRIKLKVWTNPAC